MLLDIAQKEYQSEHQTKQQAISAIANFALDGKLDQLRMNNFTEQTQSVIATKGLPIFKEILKKEKEPTIISISLKTLLILAQNQKNRTALTNSGILAIIKQLQDESTVKPIQLACSKIVQFLS